MGSHTGNARQRCSMLLSSFCPERLRVVPPDLSPISTCFPHWPVKMATTLLWTNHTTRKTEGCMCHNLAKPQIAYSPVIPAGLWLILSCLSLLFSFVSLTAECLRKAFLLVSTFCLKELRLGAQRSLYFYKTTLEKIHLNFESNLIEKLINLVLCCLISHSLWRVSSLNLCY